MDSRITDLYRRIYNAKRDIRNWETEIVNLQAKCKHEYVRTRDDDYCHTRYFFTCRKCDHMTPEYQSEYCMQDPITGEWLYHNAVGFRIPQTAHGKN